MSGTKDWQRESRHNRKDRDRLIRLARRAASPRVRMNPWAPSYGDNWTAILAQEPDAIAYVLALRPDVLLRVLGADKRRDGLIKFLGRELRRTSSLGMTIFMVAMGFSWIVIDFPGAYVCFLLQALVATVYFALQAWRDPRLRFMSLCFVIVGGLMTGGSATALGTIFGTDNRLCQAAARYQSGKNHEP